MEAKDQLRAARLQQLRSDIREGLQSGPARWNVSEMKREGRKRLETPAASSRKNTRRSRMPLSFAPFGACWSALSVPGLAPWAAF
jgi:hypothetical protein